MATTMNQQSHNSDPFIATPTPSQGWAFPGPSSRYHSRERARTQPRANSSSTLPTAPVLQTERRAHRRAQSSYTIPTQNDVDRSRAAQRFFNVHSRRSQPHSPVEYRSSLSRYSSFGSSHFTSMSERDSLSTPAKSPTLSRKHSIHHDSPSSDYFTDDSRSVDGSHPFETQQLLLRLNRLQSALISGGNDTQALHVVDRRLQEMEKDMDALHSQSRQPPELDDSGLFLEEEQEEMHTQEIKEEQAPIDESFAMLNSVNTLVDKDEILGKVHNIIRPLEEINRNLEERHKEKCQEYELALQRLSHKDDEIRHLQQSITTMKSERKTYRSSLKNSRTPIIRCAKQAQSMQPAAALELTKALRSFVGVWHDVLQQMDDQLADTAIAEDTNVVQQSELEQIQTDAMEAATGDEELHYIKCHQNLLSCLDAVEDMKRHEPAPVRYADMGTQTEAQSIVDWRDNISAAFPTSPNQHSAHEQLSRPVLEWPEDDDDTHSCAITTSPASEADPAEMTSRFARLMTAVSAFVEPASEVIDEPLKSVHQAAPAVQDSTKFWNQLMEISGFIDH